MDIFGELLYLLTLQKNQIVVLSKFKIGMLTREIVNVAGKGLSAGDIAQAMAGPAMAIAIGYALKAPAMWCCLRWRLWVMPQTQWETQEVRSRCTSL